MVWRWLLWTVTLSVASSMAQAVTFSEIADAPQTVPGQDTTGSTQPLTGILGTFTNASDVDIYSINIVDPNNFRATTFGADGLDTQLFLFDSNGFGIGANDDQDTNTTSDLDLRGTGLITAGTYSLAVSTWPFVPFSTSGPIFPDGGVLEPSLGLVLPTGVGAGGPLDSWMGSEEDLIPNYTITLTGVTGVPEPSTGLLLGFGLLALRATRVSIAPPA